MNMNQKPIKLMSNFRGTAYSNKHVKRWQQDRNRSFHVKHLNNIRPQTSSIQDQSSHYINNRKKQMIIEDRFTEIEKANRILLEKITDIMGKKRSSSTASGCRINKSLNSSFRKKQLQNIEVENAKLLKRLQQKKSNYQTQKFKEDWKKQKKVMSNLANYPFIINDRRRFNIKRNPDHTYQAKNINNKIQLCRMKNIDGTNFLITIKLTDEKLQIIGDTRKKQQVKIIEIQREQAIDFIHSECNGKVQNLFERLRYDTNQEVLYLVGQDVNIQNDLQPYQRLQRKAKQNKNQQSKQAQQLITNYQSQQLERNIQKNENQAVKVQPQKKNTDWVPVQKQEVNQLNQADPNQQEHQQQFQYQEHKNIQIQGKLENQIKYSQQNSSQENGKYKGQ